MRGTKTVLIVPGAWGITDECVARNYAEALARSFQGMTNKDDEGNEVPLAQVLIVDSRKQYDEMVALSPDAVIFTSRSSIELAHQTKAAHPNIRIVVVTGLIPQDEIIVLPKDALGASAIARIAIGMPVQTSSGSTSTVPPTRSRS